MRLSTLVALLADKGFESVEGSLLFVAESWLDKLSEQKATVKMAKALGHARDYSGLLDLWIESRPLLPNVYSTICFSLGRSRGALGITQDPRFLLLREEVETLMALDYKRWGENNVEKVNKAWKSMGIEWSEDLPTGDAFRKKRSDGNANSGDENEKVEVIVNEFKL